MDNSSTDSDPLREIQYIFGFVYVGIYGFGLIATLFASIYVEIKQSYQSSQSNQYVTSNNNTSNELALVVKKNAAMSIANSDTANKIDEEDIVVKTIGTTTEAIEENELKHQTNIVSSINTNNKGCTCSVATFKQIFQRIKQYKSIYLTSIIHFSDVITDYLVLTQYLVFAFDENYESQNNGVSYLLAAILSLLTIIMNKIFSCYYIYTFTHNYIYVLANIFDFYIFKEIYDSHKSKNKTDLLQYLQKIEKSLVFGLY